MERGRAEAAALASGDSAATGDARTDELVAGLTSPGLLSVMPG